MCLYVECLTTLCHVELLWMLRVVWRLQLLGSSLVRLGWRETVVPAYIVCVSGTLSWAGNSIAFEYISSIFIWCWALIIFGNCSINLRSITETWRKCQIWSWEFKILVKIITHKKWIYCLEENKLLEEKSLVGLRLTQRSIWLLGVNSEFDLSNVEVFFYLRKDSNMLLLLLLFSRRYYSAAGTSSTWACLQLHSIYRSGCYNNCSCCSCGRCGYCLEDHKTKM